MNPRKEAAFTLIELPVVIAILAAILSNAKGIGTANMIYAGDVDDCFPLGYSVNAGDPWVGGSMPLGPVTGFDNVNTWTDPLLPYTKNKDIFQSPVRPQAGQEPGAWCDWCRADARTPKMAFGMNPPANDYDNFSGTGALSWSGCSMSTFSEPAGKIFVTESYGGIPDFGPRCFYGFADKGEGTAGISKANGGRVRSVFADGHAKALKPLHTVRPKRMWNPADASFVVDYSPWTTAKAEAKAQQTIMDRLDPVKYPDL